MTSHPLELSLVHDLSRQRVRVGHGGKTVWQYQYAGAPKPFVHPFASPSGHVLSLASPHDHVHHRGLMLAWRVNGINFWEESPTRDGERNGTIRHDDWERLAVEQDEALLVERLEWVDPAGATCLRERRELRVRVEAGAVRCRWASTFSPVGGDAVISGETVHSKISYYGLGFRFARALDQGGGHLDAAGRQGAAEDNGQPARWHHYSGRVDESGAEVGLLIADAPGNPRHPTPWFHISHPPAPFAYVTASVIAHDEYPLRAGEELALHYVIWAHDGRWDPARCEAAWQSAFPT